MEQAVSVPRTADFFNFKKKAPVSVQETGAREGSDPNGHEHLFCHTALAVYRQNADEIVQAWHLRSIRGRQGGTEGRRTFARPWKLSDIRAFHVELSEAADHAVSLGEHPRLPCLLIRGAGNGTAIQLFADRLHSHGGLMRLCGKIIPSVVHLYSETIPPLYFSHRMSNIVSILTSIGFTESETHTYLASLESGPATVIDLTKRTDLSRQTTYLAIEKLMERGLMTSVERDGKNIFAAEPAEKLITYAKRYEQDIRERLNDLARMIPELDMKTSGSRPIVKMYEGKEAVMAVLKELNETDTPIVHEIADLESLHALIAPEQLQPLREEVGRSLRVFGLYRAPDAQTFKNADAIRLPSDTGPFHANISIFGDQVVLASYEGKMHAVMIESNAIANALRLLFEQRTKTLTRTTDS